MDVWKDEGRLKRHHNKKDRCSLDIDSEVASQRGLAKVCHHMQKAFFISKHHPYTYRYFRSYPSLVAERQHQLTESRCIIHPLSCFSLYWNIFMGVVNITHMCVASFRLAYVLPPMGAKPRLHLVDHILLTLQLIGLVDIFIQFQRGYVKRYSRATLNRMRILCYYLKRHFWIDFISCVPVTYAMLYYELKDTRCILICHFLANVQLLGIRRDLRHLHLFSMRFGTNSMLCGCLRKICLFLLSAHLLSCFTYLQGVVPYYC